MKVLAITQARTSSTRLPGKVLMEVQGKTLLEIHLNRLLRSKKIEKLIVATSNEKGDEQIVEIASACKVDSYRGSLNDVLDRFYQAALPYQPEFVVRITSDCPLIDSAIIDEAIAKLETAGVDYCSNTLELTFPDGEDVEVFTFAALERAWKESTLSSDREHVTPYIYRNSDLRGGNQFKAVNLRNTESYGDVRITVDEPEDFKVIAELIKRLGFDETWKSYADLYKQEKELQNLNSKFEYNEGYQKSLKKDKDDNKF